MSTEKKEISMHAARTALNRDPQVRQWAENWLREKERANLAREKGSAPTDEELEIHWKYVRPEKMHEGAIAAVTAYYEQGEQGEGK